MGTAGVLVVIGILSWIWAGYLGPTLNILRRGARVTAAGLVIIAGLVILADLTTAEPPPEFKGAVAMRYQASDSRLVLLQIDPFQVGTNKFGVTVMTQREEIVKAKSVQLRFSRLETESPPSEVTATPRGGSEPSYLAEISLPETGWWAIEAV